MCKRHVFKGIILWSAFIGVLAFIFSVMGFTFWFLGSPDRSTVMEMIIVPVVAITLTITLMLLFTGFSLYLLYQVNTGVWNAVHKDREGITRLLPDVLGFLISYGKIGLEWEHRGEEES